MRDFNRDDRGGDRGGRGFGARGSGRRSYGGGGGDFGRREMHHATCAQCGKDCEVPFLPKSDRPVYCSDCFEKRRNEDGGSRESGGRNYGRPNFEGRNRGSDNSQLVEQLKSLNVKLDKIISILAPNVETMLAVKNEMTDIVLKPKPVKAKTAKKKVKEEKAEPEKIL